jgi:glutamate-1-semialdehyde 2,1-aminomutase
VDAAAREGMEVGGVFALSTLRELSVAEKISRMVPAAELVRFSNSGTEAVMAGLRLARAYTGKDNYIILEGSYHGLFDAAMWYTPMENWSQTGDPEVKPYSEGVPVSTRSLAHFVQANDANQLEDVFKRHAGGIACMLIEPIMGNCLGISAEPEYLRAARSLCDKYGVVMLIDEVKTGFRVARGGVQELYGVKADLCTFAKAMGNGYPISVLAGREEIMRKIGKGVAHGGTYTAHSVSLAAAEKTLEILEETDALERIADYGTRLRQGMHTILGARGIAHSFVGHPSMSGLYFAKDPPRNYRAWKSSDYSFYDAMAKVLHDEGVLCEPDSREPWFVSAAHDDSCLADTLRGFEIAVDTTLRKSGASQKVPA